MKPVSLLSLMVPHPHTHPREAGGRSVGRLGVLKQRGGIWEPDLMGWPGRSLCHQEDPSSALGALPQGSLGIGCQPFSGLLGTLQPELH